MNHAHVDHTTPAAPHDPQTSTRPRLTIRDLHSDETLRNREFPVSAVSAFFSHAAVCPLPARVAKAMKVYTDECMRGDQESLTATVELTRFREQAARLIQAAPEEIAFVGPTSLGLSLVAGGLEFQRGDNVVVYLDDYPSTVYPWLALQENGVDIRLLNPAELGRIEPPDVLRLIDAKTRLVALSSCHFISGFRIDLDAIGRALHERGILFCVDGIQTLGAFPLSIEHIDFLAADSHKWLLGPCAAGMLYVRSSIELRPPILGWNNVYCPNFIAQENIRLRPSARRYEPGTHNLVGLMGFSAALGLILEIGPENIASELLRQRAWLVPELQNRGCVVLNADAPPQNAGGIITFYHPEKSSETLHERLQAASITTSLRADRTGRQYIRLSPHFYNTDEELKRLLAVLQDPA